MMIEHDPAVRAVEATLFASEAPMTIEQIRAYVGEEVDVPGALGKLEEHYQGRGIELVKRGKTWHFQTAADLAHLLRREREESRKLSRAAVETLAIIAYRQPVTRGDIEEIRGVAVNSQTIKMLEDRGWVDVIGHRDVPGRPALLATTRQFLDDLGLSSLDELPPLQQVGQDHRDALAADPHHDVIVLGQLPGLLQQAVQTLQVGCGAHAALLS